MIRKKACFLSGSIFSRDLAAEPGKAVFFSAGRFGLSAVWPVFPELLAVLSEAD